MCNCNCCELIIKQIYCQNGNRREEYITFNNLSIVQNATLNFGYEISTNSISDSNLTVILKDNTNVVPDQTITINNNSYKLISLPAQNGTFRIYLIYVCNY